jgi:hypothetical protein
MGFVGLLNAHCKMLEVLDLSGSDVTDVDVRQLITCPGRRLQKLVLVGCAKVDIGAVNLARARGILVDYYFPPAKGKCERSIRS